MERCVLRNSLWANGCLALLFLLFVVPMLAWGAVFTDPSLRWGLAFFGFGALLFGYKTLDRRVRVVIDDRGIAELRNSIGLIPWSEITDAKVEFSTRVDFIFVWVKDPDKWKSKVSALFRLYWRLFPKKRYISIPLQNMAVPSTDVRDFLEQAVRAHCAEARAAKSAEFQ